MKIAPLPHSPSCTVRTLAADRLDLTLPEELPGRAAALPASPPSPRGPARGLEAALPLRTLGAGLLLLEPGRPGLASAPSFSPSNFSTCRP